MRLRVHYGTFPPDSGPYWRRRDILMFKADPLSEGPLIRPPHPRKHRGNRWRGRNKIYRRLRMTRRLIDSEIVRISL